MESEEDSSSHHDLLAWIEGGGEVFVERATGGTLPVIIAQSRNGLRHLQAFDRGSGWTNALLGLPHF